MNERKSVLVAGRHQAGLEAIEMILKEDPQLLVRRRKMENQSDDPLQGMKSRIDILVYDLSELWETELQALASHPVAERPAIIAVGRRHIHEAQGILLAAMKVGVRDFFFHPVPADHLLKAVHQVIHESGTTTPVGKGIVTAIMNAKGGSGASMIACNMAYILSAPLNIRTAIIDFDLQFCSLPLYFDLPASDALFAALDNVESMDRLALDGYMTKYSKTLHLLPAVSEAVAMPWRIPGDKVSRLLFELSKAYAHIIIDLPRTFDFITKTVIEEADNVLIVLQPNVASLRDATRVVKIIRKDLGVPKERLRIVVNRYSSGSVVSLKDIEKSMDVGIVDVIPNDYEAVSSASDIGEPLFKRVPDAEVTKAIARIVYDIAGLTPTKDRPSLLSRILGKGAK
jgi:pilus assembly protein CpaE